MKLTLLSAGKDLIHIGCEGEISQREFQPGEKPLASLLGPAGFTHAVLMNLEKTTYIDSSGIGWLLACHKQFVANGGILVLHSVPPRVDHILQIVRMPLVLHIAADEAAARAVALEGRK
jgi:anti-anti-sigma factor